MGAGLLTSPDPALSLTEGLHLHGSISLACSCARERPSVNHVRGRETRTQRGLTTAAHLLLGNREAKALGQECPLVGHFFDHFGRRLSGTVAGSGFDAD
jgi:hypothetical protein